MSADAPTSLATRSGSAFLYGADAPAVAVAPGIRRRILRHGPELMLCRVEFEAGAVGDRHAHPHAQVTYVESGRFLFHIDGEDRELAAGDSCYMAPHRRHGTVCVEAGVLIDAFTPARLDFLSSGEPT